MATLQFVIDNICASFPAEFLYRHIRERLSEGEFEVDEILPAIQDRDKSLDVGSARQLAEAALEDLEEEGILKLDGDIVLPAV